MHDKTKAIPQYIKLLHQLISIDVPKGGQRTGRKVFIENPITASTITYKYYNTAAYHPNLECKLDTMKFDENMFSPVFPMARGQTLNPTQLIAKCSQNIHV